MRLKDLRCTVDQIGSMMALWKQKATRHIGPNRRPAEAGDRRYRTCIAYACRLEHCSCRVALSPSDFPGVDDQQAANLVRNRFAHRTPGSGAHGDCWNPSGSVPGDVAAAALVGAVGGEPALPEEVMRVGVS